MTLSWPAFDAGAAINHVISGVITLAGVFVGGFLAFRLGIRQLRHARAIDRRLEWLEALHDRIAALNLAVFFLAVEENKFAGEPGLENARNNAQTVMERVADLERIVYQARLFGSAAEKEWLAALREKATEAQGSALMIRYGDRAKFHAAAFASLEPLSKELDKWQDDVAKTFRNELGVADANPEAWLRP